MNKIDVLLHAKSYQIIIDKSFHGLKHHLTFLNDTTCKIAVITDDIVAECQLEKFLAEFDYPSEQIFYYVIKHGENSKSLDMTKAIYQFLLDIQIGMGDAILALGGGVVGDITGFAAGTYFRGIPFVQVPTTLLAQIDSSIGGKAGVNFHGIKNVIGVFHQPELVYININVLRTLPKKEIRNGLAEAMVHGMIADSTLITLINENITDIYDLKEEVIIPLVFHNCKIKSQIVEMDELDRGIRHILNFGHTFGHAVESVLEYGYSHGECVSLGIVAALKSSVYLNVIDYNIYSYIKNVLFKLGLPVDLSGLNWEQIVDRIKYDKKTKSGVTSFILPKEIGEVIPYQLKLDDRLIAYLLKD